MILLADEHSRSLPQPVKALGDSLERSSFAAYLQLQQRPLRLIWLNFIGGLARGVGIGIGFTLFAAAIFLILQKLALVNLPLIGAFIADLVRIVQAQLRIPTI